MNRFTKIIFSIAIIFTTSSSAIGSENSGVSIVALDCQIEVPAGYVLSVDSAGTLRGDYVGKDLRYNPHFQFFPSTAYESRAALAKRVIRESSLGDYRFLRVELGGDVEWDVVIGESSFFATQVSPNSPFISQFEACTAGS